jgi:hypothetical protein
MTDEEQTLEQGRLAAKINQFLGRPMNGRTLQVVDEILVDHRTRCRLRGLDFPEVVAVIMPTAGNIDVVRRDLDRSGIEILIVNLARKYPSVSRDDLAFGINRAFPGYAKMIDRAEQHKGWTPTPA